MFIGELWRRIAFLLDRRRRAGELEDEMRLHAELREKKLRSAGMEAQEAAHAARLRFGNRTLLKEVSEEMWGWSWLDVTLQDLRYAVRLMRATPVFSVVVVLTLALGIGANSAIFSIMNAVVLRSLPVAEPDRLVYLRTTNNPRGSHQTGHGPASFPEHVFEQLRTERTVFADVMAYVPMAIGKVAVRHGSEPEEANADMVSGNFFSGLGVRMACGRALTRDDETGHTQVAVLSHAFWSRRFAQSPAILGQTLHVQGVPFTIVGVAGKGFIGVEHSQGTDVWVPLQNRPDLNAWGMQGQDTLYGSPNWWCLMMIGRLAPGVDEKQAAARLNPVFQRAAYAHLERPGKNEKPPDFYVEDAHGIPGLRESYETPLRVLLAMVGLVLVIACGNVALLLVARNTARQREFSLRIALGGGRFRLLRQLLTESLLMVAAGTALAWLFATSATDALRAWSGLNVDLSPDRSVLWFTLAVSALAALVFGLAPLRSALRAPIGLTLKTSSATAHQDRQRTRGRRTVIALQVSMCLVLLVSAGLLVRTLRNLERVNLGMRTSGLLVFGISPQQRAQSNDEAARFYAGLLDRVRSVPGVESVTAMQNRIASGWSNNTSAVVDGKRPEGRSGMRWNAVGPDYFRTLGTPLVYGRDFTQADSQEAAPVAIVNETFAKQYLANRNPLGHYVALSDRKDAAQFRIVGVAADSKYTGVREPELPMAYFPYPQLPGIAAMHIELRAAGPPAALLPAVTRAVREYAPGLPLLQPSTQQQQFESTFSDEKLFARLAMFFGLLAVILVATGLYGTLSYTVSRRTAEVGIRMALGAQRSEVLWMVLRGNLVVCLGGILAGLPLAFGAARLLRSMLFGVAPEDPLTFAAALIGIGLVALAASLLPAWRAASVAPTAALRYE